MMSSPRILKKGGAGKHFQEPEMKSAIGLPKREVRWMEQLYSQICMCERICVCLCNEGNLRALEAFQFSQTLSDTVPT